MRARTLGVVALTAVAAACAKPHERPAGAAARPNYLIGVPYLPQSVVQDTTGSPEAQQLVLLAPKPIDSVAAFYRRALPMTGWQIMGDIGDTIHVSLYLVRDGRPLWVQIDAQGPESRVTLTAAGADTAAQQTPR